MDTCSCGRYILRTVPTLVSALTGGVCMTDDVIYRGLQLLLLTLPAGFIHAVQIPHFGELCYISMKVLAIRLLHSLHHTWYELNSVHE